MVGQEVTVDTIEEIMNSNDDAFIETVVPTSYEENGITNVRPDRIEIFSKAHSGFGYQPHFDSVDYTNVMQYHIDEIEQEKVAYLVSEHVVNPGKCSDLLERVYHEPFDSLEEAIAYEIISEAFSGYYSNTDNVFSKKFVNECIRLSEQTNSKGGRQL